MEQADNMQSTAIVFVNGLLEAIAEIVLLKTGNEEAAAIIRAHKLK